MFTCKYCKNDLFYVCGCVSQCGFTKHRPPKRSKAQVELEDFEDEYGTIEEIDACLAAFHLKAGW